MMKEIHKHFALCIPVFWFEGSLVSNFIVIGLVVCQFVKQINIVELVSSFSWDIRLEAHSIFQKIDTFDFMH